MNTINTLTKKSVITADIFGTVLTLTFINGEALEIDAATLPADIAMQATLHGLKQKLVDAAAIARNTETGASATVNDKIAAVKEVHARLTSPNPTWNKVRAAGEGGGNNLLARALMKMTGKDAAGIAAYLENKTKEEKAALRKNPRVATLIAEMQAAAAATDGIDTDSLLAELMPEELTDTDGNPVRLGEATPEAIAHAAAPVAAPAPAKRTPANKRTAKA